MGLQERRNLNEKRLEGHTDYAPASNSYPVKFLQRVEVMHYALQMSVFVSIRSTLQLVSGIVLDRNWSYGVEFITPF